MNRDLVWRPSAGSLFLPRGQQPLYSHPYEDLAALAMPRNMRSALEWSQFIVSTSGPYHSALKRVVAYCITDIEIVEAANASGDAVGKEVKQNYEKLFSDEYMRMKTQALAVGVDLLTYGNSFVSVFTKFTRYLLCQGHTADGRPCSYSAPLKTILEQADRFQFSFTGFEFQATCPHCGCTTSWKVKDQHSRSMEDMYVHRWDPTELDILYDPFTKQPIIEWRIPSDYSEMVKRGMEHVLETVPLEILDAIKQGSRFTFNRDMILHLKREAMAGIKSRGWGIPDTFANFRQAWLYQVCNHHTETTAMEALAPLRIISPPSSGGNGDPIYKNINMGSFTRAAKNAINTKRRDPSAWFVFPCPVQYQAVGGDASQFIPRDLLDYSLDTLLTSAGVPVELYKGSLTLQAAPVALRLFRSYWQSLVAAFNTFLNFTARRASEILGWEPVQAKFADVELFDDINKQVQTLQLMSSGMVSQTTGLAAVGIDKKEEVRRIAEEQRDEAEQQDRMQKEMETARQFGDMVGGGTLGILGQIQQQQQAAAQGGGGASPMGMPGQGMPFPGAQMAGATVPGANGQGMASLLPGMDPISQMIAQMTTQPTDSIQDVYAKAQTLAQQMLMGNTASNLRKLQKQDPQMHGIVKGLVDQMRSNARSEGGQMLLQQYGAGG